MAQTIINIGNSQGVIIPKELLNDNGIKTGDKVTVIGGGNKGIHIYPAKDTEIKSVDARYMKMVDEFIEDHKDVLEALANR